MSNIYHCSIKIGKRSAGRSAVASAAYRSAEKLRDEEQGEVFDYTRKSKVIGSDILLCKNAPEEYSDRATLWNAVQKIEKNKDAQLFREIEIALPNDWTWKERIKYTREFVKEQFVNNGMCADICFHDKDNNPHAHIMLTMRQIKENGKWDVKERKKYKLDNSMRKIPKYDEQKLANWVKENGRDFDYRKEPDEELKKVQKIGAKNRREWERVTVRVNDWNESYKAEEWREAWANKCNEHLAENSQVDHRSYERQGINHIPTIHEGYQARQIELNGGISERMEYNRQVEKINEQIDKQEETIEKKGKEYNEFGRGESISGTTETNNRDNGRTNGANQGTATDDRKAESGNSELQGDSSSARDRVERLGDELQQVGERIETTGRRSEEQDIAGERRTERETTQERTRTEATRSGIREASQGEREPAEVYRQRVNGIRTEQQDINGKQPEISSKQQSINREANANIRGQRSFTQGFNEHLERVRGGFTAVRDKLKGAFENVLKTNLQRAVERLRHLKSQAPEQEKPKQTTQEQPKQTQTAQSPLERMQQAQRMNAAEPTERSENNMSRGTNSLLQQAKASNEANKEADTVKDKETPKNEAMDKFKELKAKTEANREEELEEAKHIHRGRHR